MKATLTDIEKLKDRLCKVKALADYGCGGERAVADRLLRTLAAKHDVSLDSIGSEVEREHTVEAAQAWRRRLFVQLLGLMRIEQYGDRHADKLLLSFAVTRVRRGRTRRPTWTKRYYTVCTDAQWLELSAKFAVLCADYRRQLRAFPLAFLMRNDLLMPYDPSAPENSAAEDERYGIAERLSAGIERSRLHRQLEAKEAAR